MERFVEEVDVCIVGGGPAGMAAAIRAKQIANENGEELRVCILEKSSEIGGHILSGKFLYYYQPFGCATNSTYLQVPLWTQ